MSDENTRQPSEGRSRLGEVAINAECSPRVVVPPEPVRIESRVEWPGENETAAPPEVELLSMDGKVLLHSAMAPSEPGGREKFFAEVMIGQEIGPGFYNFAVSVPGKSGSYLALLTVVEQDSLKDIALFNTVLGDQMKAIEQTQRGDWVAAQPILVHCAESYEKLEFRQVAAQTWVAAGSVALQTSDWNKARVLTEQGLAIFEDLKDERGAAACHLQLGEIHLAARRFRSAQNHLNAAAALHERLDMPAHLYREWGSLFQTALRWREAQRNSLIYRYWRPIWGLLVLFIAMQAASAIWFPGRLSVVGQLVAKYVVSTLLSLVTYCALAALRVKRAPDWARLGVSRVITAGDWALYLGACAFLLSFWWWSSPFAPIKAKATIHASLRQELSAVAGARLEGTALLPADRYLWMFVQSNQLWYAVSEVRVDHNDAWRLGITPAQLKKFGCNIKVALVTLPGQEHERLRSSMLARDPGVLSPIEMPASATVDQELHIQNSENCVQPAVPRPPRVSLPAPPPPPPKPPVQTKPLSDSDEDHAGNVPSSVFPDLNPNYKADMQTNLSMAERRIIANSQDWDAYMQHGSCFSELGNQDWAIADLSKSLDLKETAGAHNFRGIARQRKGLLNEAIEDFERAVQLDSESKVFKANLQHARNIQTHRDDLIDYWRDLADHRPFDAEANLRAGAAFSGRGLRRLQPGSRFRTRGLEDLRLARYFLEVARGSEATANQAEAVLRRLEQ